MHSIAGELGGLVVGDRASRRIADEELDRRRDGGDRQGHEQTEPVVPVAAAAQHADGVDGGEDEPGDHVGRQEHVEELVAGRRC